MEFVPFLGKSDFYVGRTGELAESKDPTISVTASSEILRGEKATWTTFAPELIRFSMCAGSGRVTRDMQGEGGGRGECARVCERVCGRVCESVCEGVCKSVRESV